VIICTILEKSSTGFGERAAQLGAADYLMKPILADDLYLALRRLDENHGFHAVMAVCEEPAEMESLVDVFHRHADAFHLTLAQNGPQTLAAIRYNRPDAILLSLDSPQASSTNPDPDKPAAATNLDGFGFLETLCHDPVLTSLPVIVLLAQQLDDPAQTRLDQLSPQPVRAVVRKGLKFEERLFANLEQILEPQAGA
jgi:CheY-like chemotaxis protein